MAKKTYTLLKTTKLNGDFILAGTSLELDTSEAKDGLKRGIISLEGSEVKAVGTTKELDSLKAECKALSAENETLKKELDSFLIENEKVETKKVENEKVETKKVENKKVETKTDLSGKDL